MKVPLTVHLPGPGWRLWVDLRRDGIGFIAELRLGLQILPRLSATLVLRWLEFAVICVILAVVGTTVSFRRELADSWLVSVWAIEHSEDAAALIGLTALSVGALLAYWKRKQLFVYGTWEIVFGTFSAFQIGLFLFPPKDVSKLVAFASALYVVSRGVGNVLDAFDKEVAIERLKLEVVPGTPPENWPQSIIGRATP